jgi:uncharacterized membrane protein
MWIVGVVIGLAIGAMLQSAAGAVLLAVLGGLIASSVFGKKKDAARQPGQRAPLAQPVPPENASELSTLQWRVAELEQRVVALEWRLSNAGLEEAPEPPEPPPEAEPAAPPPIVRPARVEPAAAYAVAPAEPELEPELAEDAFDAPAPVEVEPPPPAKPPPPPPVPLRDRLPAPIANLIFGGNLLVKLGVLILFLGLAFLLRYTAERVTVPIELRYAGVALAGAALLALGWVLRRKRAGYALVLQGAGIGVFYLTTLAAMKVHGLLPPVAGFALMFGVAVLGAALAVLQNSQALAVVAALAGFATPVLVSTGTNRPVALFTYLLVLDLGIALMAWFKAWRPLNLIGFVGTFTLAAGWARQYYSDDQFGIAQPFLIVFFLLFTAIGLLFARRTLFDAPADAAKPLAERAMQTLRRAGRVDSALVFGVPLAAFGMQYLLMRPWEYGAAFSALALAAFYLALGRLVFATQPAGLALLAEAYAIVGVIFGTLAIPLGLEGRWTGAAWAVEAAGIYWLGVRQQRVYARAFSFVVFAGAVWKLLQDLRLDVIDGDPLLQGSAIGPVLVAAGAFVMWALHRRAKLDEGRGWEPLAGSALPWLGMAALTLLPWQWFTPAWAAAGTAVLATAAFAVAARFGLRAFAPVSYGMQTLAVASFIATLHRGAGEQALDAGWQGALAAALIALNVLGCAAWSMMQVARAARERDVPPEWPVTQIVGALAGVGLLHLATLFQISLAQAALLWPLSALIVLRVALRLAHGPLAVMALALNGVSALIFMATYDGGAGPAFAHLGFWTPVALGLSALLAGDWLRAEARHVSGDAQARGGRWINRWCAQPFVLWAPVVWGLVWWLGGMLNETGAVLIRRGQGDVLPAAAVAVALVTSILSAFIARRRDWPQLGMATLATLPGFALIALYGAAVIAPLSYVPSSGWGWIAWPLALLWHLRLLWTQRRWFAERALAPFHIAGFWLFVLLAARECQWQFGRLGDPWSSWPLLGWALAPALVLWALRSRLLLARWPIAAYRASYLEVAALPVAACLLAWAWVANLWSAGDAAPLPYVPLLNPMELMLWLSLFAVALWWRALPPSSWVRGLPPVAAQAVVGLTALAILTATVLRAIHHYAGVEWNFNALWDSRQAQAAISITWALCGVGAMVLGHARRLRALWIAGAALMGVVVLKLFFVELADRGGLFRIVSFLAVGALLLVVGYFAPVPPRREEPSSAPP